MGSETAAEGARLLAGLSALFLGLAAGIPLRSVLRPRRRGGSGGHAAVFAALSACVAAAAWSAVILLRGRLPAGALPWYAGTGLAAGLAAGLFPLAAGLPLAALGAAAWGLASIAVRGWEPWAPGALVAAVGVYATPDAGSVLVAVSTGGGASPPELNATLAPGGLSLAGEAMELRGPFAFLVGPRFWRLDGLARVEAGGPSSGGGSDPGHAIPLERDGAPDAARGWLARLAEFAAPRLGLKRRPLVSEAFQATPLAGATFYLDGEAGLRLETR